MERSLTYDKCDIYIVGYGLREDIINAGGVVSECDVNERQKESKFSMD